MEIVWILNPELTEEQLRALSLSRGQKSRNENCEESMINRVRRCAGSWPTSELVQADLFPDDAAAAEARRDRSQARPWCADCGVDTLAIDEFYMVKDEIWEAVWPGSIHGRMTDFLCIGCLELRLGRRLTPDDFTACALNEPEGASRRMRDRLGRAQ